jgi:superfamily II DNA or RNA helicase
MNLGSQMPFDFTRREWPANNKFPLNLKSYSRTVEAELFQDIQNSHSYLIITGFTSLEYLVFLYEKLPQLSDKKVRIVLGFDPTIRERKQWPFKEFSEAIKDYWLYHGISPLLSGGVINLINEIKSGNIEFRFSDKIHAKIYVGETHAILGSSNFSQNGLKKQREANIRVHSNSPIERDQFVSIENIAENFYLESQVYTKMEDLLNQLLVLVGWQDAICRAVAILLEGDWIQEYPEAFKHLDKISLWGTQRTAIAQALLVMDNKGSVLIADPTGSGKTRLVSCIQLALISRRWQEGRGDQAYPQIICPPIVKENWTREFESLHYPHPVPVSSGILSFQGSDTYKRVIEKLKSCNILIVDEAHNYLNPKSVRSLSLKNSFADSILLVTATPINKKAEDLLRLIELLDIDNLEDEELQEFKALKKSGTIQTSEQVERLRTYINKFTVRRTKKQLNKIVEASPNNYLNKNGNPCKYPEHICKTYKTGESSSDKIIAEQINKETHKLRGLINLRKLLVPPDRQNDLEWQERELRIRLISAQALVKYQIRARLRSSRASLIEHIEGTKASIAYFKFDAPDKDETGNIIEKLNLFIAKNRLPKTIEFSPQLLPEFLKNFDQYKIACQEEIEIYQRIAQLTKQISENRENTKAKKINDLIDENGLIIAFDSSLLTLYYLQHIITRNNWSITPHVVTGKSKIEKKKVMEIFGIGSKEKGHVALCSDSMSEGVNLQQASAIILLDMPSVLRLAEQRIGRLDRMDSPHSSINAYWPDDSDEFALRTDKKLIRISFMADYLIGSNLDIPSDLIEKLSDETIHAKDFIKEYKQIEKSSGIWDGIFDAFEHPRSLVEGENSIVEDGAYEYYKGVSADIKCKVSPLETNASFGFFAFRGNKSRAPRWLMVTFNEEGSNVDNDLQTIAMKLREVLPGATALRWSEGAKKLMEHCLRMIDVNEIELLPPKKKRALKLLVKILSFYKKKKDLEPRFSALVSTVLEKLQPDDFTEEIVDYYYWMESWIKIIQPSLFEIRRAGSQNSPKDISDLFKYFKKHLITVKQLEELLSNLPLIERAEHRIASCIIGLSKKPTS